MGNCPGILDWPPGLGVELLRCGLRPVGIAQKGTREKDIVSSTDMNFRPIDTATGPDGALYVIDWHNPLIGHLQSHLRDSNRDHVHGRIYRITAEGRPLAWQPKIDGAPISALLELLKRKENQIRNLAKIELGKHDSAKVVAATKAWVARLETESKAGARNPAHERRDGQPAGSAAIPPLTQRAATEDADADYEHHLLEALWVHQWHNVVDIDLLSRVLRSPNADARAAGPAASTG